MSDAPEKVDPKIARIIEAIARKLARDDHEREVNKGSFLDGGEVVRAPTQC